MCSTFLIFTMFLVAELVICCFGEEFNTTLGCISREKNALLKFKASLSDPSDRLSTWNASIDCCEWQGIKCDRTSGHVIRLDLQNPRYGDSYPSSSSSDMLHSGTLDSSISDLKHLSFLDLSGNDFHQTFIPSFLGLMNQTQHLNLSYSNFSGGVPHHLGNLSSLRVLDLSFNGLSGPLPNWIWYINMTHLDLSDNCIEGAIPDLLCEAKPLRFLDLSKNRLSGNLPECWEHLNHLRFLSSSWNYLSGVIPNSIGGAYSLEWLQLSTNRFTGELPPTLRNCTKLQVLDVGENLISGEVPEWIGNHLLNLKVLRLRCNEFYGTIPSELCQLSGLQILDLANNRLTGSIPHCFDNFTYMALYNSTVKSSAKNGLRLMIKGEALVYFATLKYVVYMDLSNNSLVGEIPAELTRLVALHFLNLSYNHLQGGIPQRIGDMRSLESLDLSNNNLSGNIPRSFAYLTFLSRLNLSSNNLTGEIPTGYQLQTLGDTSIYEGNPGLCGEPLTKKCQEGESTDTPDAKNHDAEGEEDEAEKIWFYGVIITGFATGFWGSIGVLVFKHGWRCVYFKFADEIIARFFGAL